MRLIQDYDFDVIIHQRPGWCWYSIEHPKEYVNTNLVGTFNILEIAKAKMWHLLAASTSSVYGSNKNMPFAETKNSYANVILCRNQMNELDKHAYAHIFNILITMFRFFNGPLGRPIWHYLNLSAPCWKANP